MSPDATIFRDGSDKRTATNFVQTSEKMRRDLIMIKQAFGKVEPYTENLSRDIYMCICGYSSSNGSLDRAD
jgi:hypothetical protein